MTVTTDSVRSALELAPEHDHVDSHLHPEGSFDVADHEVPTGREEIWRFTPLKRLRGLHADAEFMPSETTCTWTTHEGVRIEGVDVADEPWMRGLSGLVPNTRWAARVMAEVPSSLLVDVPADTEVAEPIVVDLDGTDVARHRGRPRRDALRGAQQGDRGAQPHRLVDHRRGRRDRRR